MVSLTEPNTVLVRKRRNAGGLRNAAIQHFRRGIKRSDEERLAEALQEFDEALLLLPDDPIFLNNRGAVLDHMGNHKKALADFDEVLAKQPNDAVALHNRGVALAQLGRYEDAIVAYEQALAVQPNDPGTLANRGLALAHLGRLDEALETLDMALEIGPREAETEASRAAIVGELLRGLRQRGVITWGGGKPQGSDSPAKLTPGPDVSGYVVENRR